MFEKYIGRKTTPPVEIKSSESFEGTDKKWWGNEAQDPEFMSWFSGSVVADSAGNPIPVFHGTRSRGALGDVYKADVYELGMHFGTAEAANERLQHVFESDIRHAAPDKQSHQWTRDFIKSSPFLSKDQIEQELAVLDKKQDKREEEHQERIAQGILGGEKVYPVFLKITNPVRISDPGSFSPDNLKSIRKDLIKNFVTRDQVEKIQSVKTIDELRHTLIELGYDGVVYENSVEGRGSDSYIPIIGPDQIRSVFAGEHDN